MAQVTVSRPTWTTQPLSSINAWIKAIFGLRDHFAPLLHDTNASINRAFSWIALAGAVATLIFVALVQVDALADLDLARIYGFPALLCAVPGGALVGLLLFIIYTGITHALATPLSNTGTYDRLVYVYAAYSAPLLVLFMLLTITGYVLPLALGLYIAVLNVLAVRAVYRLRWLAAALCGLWLPLLLLAVGVGIVLKGAVTVHF